MTVEIEDIPLIDTEQDLDHMLKPTQMWMRQISKKSWVECVSQENVMKSYTLPTENDQHYYKYVIHIEKSKLKLTEDLQDVPLMKSLNPNLQQGETLLMIEDISLKRDVQTLTYAAMAYPREFVYVLVQYKSEGKYYEVSSSVNSTLANVYDPNQVRGYKKIGLCLYDDVINVSSIIEIYVVVDIRGWALGYVFDRFAFAQVLPYVNLKVSIESQLPKNPPPQVTTITPQVQPQNDKNSGKTTTTESKEKTEKVDVPKPKTPRKEVQEDKKSNDKTKDLETISKEKEEQDKKKKEEEATKQREKQRQEEEDKKKKEKEKADLEKQKKEEEVKKQKAKDDAKKQIEKEKAEAEKKKNEQKEKEEKAKEKAKEKQKDEEEKKKKQKEKDKEQEKKAKEKQKEEEKKKEEKAKKEKEKKKEEEKKRKEKEEKEKKKK
ncbi:protein FAM133A, putative [Entamoeba invadens IP1]|uniref:protein FAM133A, putative n=1 Tax=Entamoeba invadens IP1 TaxID=370355 RepID=UPI0002C3E3A1|nr:protein FAM133A, putative [Entamoeba invadens IP1]ELP93126.1 protein FAM133A, putative [Entamoeba invadens IP1]|eukprot:XP_004259897.1 protein FAM133A, putative [Entamoeba invadens IP1]